ncbi:MAG: universal stress protein [Myxococcales bacterium]
MSAQILERVAVVGVDFSDAGDLAIRRGLAWLAAQPDRTLHLFHVIDPRDVIDDPEYPALLTEADGLALAPDMLGQRALALAHIHGLSQDLHRVKTHARIGRAVETLLQACADYGADLLFVGTHGRRGIERLVLGSVAETLVRKARCPVIVARQKDYSGIEKTPLPDAPYAAGEARPTRSKAAGFEPTRSTESDSWHPSDNGPTGVRIV